MSVPQQPLEIKAVPAEFKADAAHDGVIEGYFSVFNNLDDGGDVIEPGAFTKTLAEAGGRLKCLYQHDATKIIGGKPLAIYEDSHGLYAKVQLVLGSFWGRECHELVKAGAISEGSIGYRVPKGRAEYRDGARHLTEVGLWEVSPVPWGMNDQTLLAQAKALSRQVKLGGMDNWEVLDLLQTVLSYVAQADALSEAPADTLTEAAAWLDSAQQVILGLLAAAAPAAANAGMKTILPVYTTLADLRPDLKIGATLSAANRAKVTAALEALQALLDAATPDAPKAVHLAPLARHRARLNDLLLAYGSP